MALVDYKKYQVLINPDSKKVQGLQVGDVVRRQYFNGIDTIYSLMCVLENGVERTKNSSTGLYEDRPYFIGALLDGDGPVSGNNEILDFARVANLFNEERSGALYLTASDSQAPYMDVIDGIGKNKSLSWPEAIASKGFEDAQTQYIVKGTNFNVGYSSGSQANNRILTVTRMKAAGTSFEGLKQDFYEFVKSGDKVLISYKICGSKAITGAGVSVGYTDDLHTDAEWNEDISTSWEYKFRVVTIEYSGRHLRSFKIDMSQLAIGEEIQIADFNIILLSSLTNFDEASVTRVGKLDGVTDNVFGQISGYGAYLQKLYASRSAHISGTLTAGDENGFGATFYAGKIHRNCFINSLSPNFISSTQTKVDDTEISNPTGVGSVYRSNSAIEFTAQDNAWLTKNVGNRYCFSFWLYMKQAGSINVYQNSIQVGDILVSSSQTHSWHRVSVSFDVLQNDGNMTIKLSPSFSTAEYDKVSSSETSPNENVFYFTAPQLEVGNIVAQYQATDDVLSTTDEYGAWFNRGGIGGTMQNPLLQLNFADEEGNEGGIGTRSKSFLLKQDGSGYLAKKNITWDENGKVTFGDKVTLNWNNLDDDIQSEIADRYCRILGEDTFSILDSNTNAVVNPASITLTINEVGFSSTSEQRQWLYKKDNDWCILENENGLSLTVLPDSDIWGGYLVNGSIIDGANAITIKCIVTLDDAHIYTDTKTIRKQYVQGYSVNVVSSSGVSFQNGNCSTTLTANVYYQGTLLDLDYVKKHFAFTWHRYRASDMSELVLSVKSTEVNNLVLDYELDASEIYSCELTVAGTIFDYSFPVLF